MPLELLMTGKVQEVIRDPPKKTHNYNNFLYQKESFSFFIYLRKMENG